MTMPISAPGRSRPPNGFTSLRRSAEHGFTLIELLIVLTIIGLMSAAVVLAMPEGRGSLIGEAERFAARAHAAQEQAVLDARAISIRVTSAGYGFDRREKDEWKPIDRKPFTDQAWSEGTRAGVGAGAQRIVFDSTGTSEPMRLLLVREDEQVVVEIRPGGKIHVVA
jgi:general secretion pathway protein H